jgi:hypothetical protein
VCVADKTDGSDHERLRFGPRKKHVSPVMIPRDGRTGSNRSEKRETSHLPPSPDDDEDFLVCQTLHTQLTSCEDFSPCINATPGCPLPTLE